MHTEDPPAGDLHLDFFFAGSKGGDNFAAVQNSSDFSYIGPFGTWAISFWIISRSIRLF